MAPLTLDFFHDAVCCWSFNLSWRLRRLSVEFPLDIRHRSFVLQASPEEMKARWGDPAHAREAILGHWQSCRAESDRPALIDHEAMRGADFDYPHGMVAARACKAAERLGGQAAHWDLFDRLQLAHLAEARNIADPAELIRLAAGLGLDRAGFAAALAAAETAAAVEADRRAARALQVRTVPTLILRETGTRLGNGPIDHLRAQLRRAAAHLI